MYDENKVVVPPSLGIEAKTLYNGVQAAAAISMCQWFKRLWVLQEFCFAKQVIFAIDNKEMDIQVITTGFNLVQDVYGVFLEKELAYGDDDSIYKNIGSKYAPILAPQIQDGTYEFFNGLYD